MLRDLYEYTAFLTTYFPSRTSSMMVSISSGVMPSMPASRAC